MLSKIRFSNNSFYSIVLFIQYHEANCSAVAIAINRGRNLLLLAENSVRSLLQERLVTASGVVANGVVNVVCDLVLKVLAGSLLGVWLDSRFDFVANRFSSSVRHVYNIMSDDIKKNTDQGTT